MKVSKSNHKGFGSKRKTRRVKSRLNSDRIYTWAQTLYGPIFQEIPLGNHPELPFIKDEGQRKMEKKWYGFWRTKRSKRFLGRMPFFANVVYGISRDTMIKSLQTHINWFESTVYDKGRVYAIKLFKRVHDACLRFAADHDFERIIELKLHKDGLPLKVGHLIPLLSSHKINDRRAAIQVLNIIKLCEVPGDTPTVSSITEPSLGSRKVKGKYIGETFDCYGSAVANGDLLNTINSSFRAELERMFPSKLKAKRIKELRSLADIHMSVRNGPNGAAMGTLIEDFYAITNSGLKGPIREISELTGNSQLVSIIDELDSEISKALETEFTIKDSITSKLGLKYEPWGKTRPFAICDWYSQSALKSIHKWIFHWLASQPEDGTMSQDLVAEIVRQWSEVYHLSPDSIAVELYSLDLSKATDRLPATLQREILQHIFGKGLADKWYTICTDRTFTSKFSDPVRFEVGQPLGVYSSWAMLALTHHVICRIALKLSGNPRNKLTPRYVVIGDDQAMVGRRSMRWYSFIMKNILQVDISPIKGFTPETSLGGNPLTLGMKTVSAELAKRVFIDGEELSVVSPQLLIAGMEYPGDFPSLIHQLYNRGCFKRPRTPVAPLALAAAGYKPETACILATFPPHSGISEETLKNVRENYPNLLNFVPWFQTEIPISESELDTMFRYSIKRGLQGTLTKFQDQFNMYIKLARAPTQSGERMYHFKTKEYIIRALLNKAMVNILNLIEKTDALNFQGSGVELDAIASALNQLSDFSVALLGKPSGKRENLNRMRSRTITTLVPWVWKSIQKARDNYGILLLEAGEQITFVRREIADITNLDIYNRGLLSMFKSRLAHDQWFSKVKYQGERSSLDE